MIKRYVNTAVTTLAIALAVVPTATAMETFPATDVMPCTMPAPNERNLVVKQNGEVVMTKLFLDNVETNLMAVDYAYLIAKGNNRLADQQLVKLQQKGWELVGMFSALEGEFLDHSTIAGGIFYNKEQNLYLNTLHGTLDSKGWEMNVNQETTDASDLRAHVIYKMRDELVHHLRAEKKFFGGSGQNANLDKLIKLAKMGLTTIQSNSDIETFRMNFINQLKQKLPALADKTAKKGMLREIEACFAVKLELLKYLNAGPSLKFDGRVNKGYALKLASAYPEIVAIIKRHAAQLPAAKLAQARMMVSGHSKGAAEAFILGAALQKDIPDMFGRSFKQGDVMVHAVSAPPAVDYTFKASIEKALGIANIVDHYAEGDLVRKGDLARNLPDGMRKLAAKLPIIGKKIAGALDSDLASHIGTPLVDDVADVHARAEKHFPNAIPSWLNVPKRLAHNKVAIPHFGIDLGDNQPNGENFGRRFHFEPLLAMPLNGSPGFNALLQRGLAKHDIQTSLYVSAS